MKTTTLRMKKIIWAGTLWLCANEVASAGSKTKIVHVADEVDDDEDEDAADESASSPDVNATRKGWRFGNAIGYSPVCLGPQRAFGHYRCGGVFEFTASPPPDHSVFLKGAFHGLKRTQTLSEDAVTTQRTYAIEEVNLSTLLIGKNWIFDQGYIGVGAGLFGGQIKRSVEPEDEYFSMQADEHSRYVSISGFAFTTHAGHRFLTSRIGDFGAELTQTWFLTTEATNPRDDRRVWATLPTLSFGWSYQLRN